MWKRRQWSKLAALPRRKVLLLIEAALCLAAARLALLVLPFPRIAAYLGRLRPPSPQPSIPNQEQATARDIGWAVERAARVLPFRAVCLPRALAAWQMLHIRHVPSRLHFGASKPQPGTVLATHAWLDASGIEVTGYPEANHFVELGYFTR
jgi:hypothetical protein